MRRSWACCGRAATRRDRFIVLALWRMGLRRGELTGLRGEDVHFVPDATRLGCGVKGPHVHVRRRDNPNGAAAKSRRHAGGARGLAGGAGLRPVHERPGRLPGRRGRATSCWSTSTAGRPARRCGPGALNDLLAALSRRAGLARQARPHMARHAFAANVAASGATLDEIKDLLGHCVVHRQRGLPAPQPGPAAGGGRPGAGAARRRSRGPPVTAQLAVTPRPAGAARG